MEVEKEEGDREEGVEMKVEKEEEAEIEEKGVHGDREQNY